MAVLILADHKDGAVSQPTRSAVAAAIKLGEVHVLLTGEGAGAVASAAAKLPGVAKVRHAEGAAYAHVLAEPLAALILSLAPGYTHLLAPASASGKTATVAAEVWMRPWASVAGTRCTRWPPDS